MLEWKPLFSYKDMWAITFRGSWAKDRRFEINPKGEKITLTHGKKVV